MSDTEAVVPEPTTNGAKRGRGRPKKDPNNAKAVKETKAQDNGVSDGTNGSDQEVRAKRGRKAKSAPKAVAKVSNSGVSAAKRGRGRPKKGAKGQTGGKKRGRKAGSKKSESVEEEAAPIDETIDEDEHEDGEEEEEDDED